MKGLFDMYRWNTSMLDDAMLIHTEDSKCRPEDKGFLTQLIESRGGFERLDTRIASFRSSMKAEMEAFLKRTMSNDEDDEKEERENYFKGDWWEGNLQVD